MYRALDLLVYLRRWNFARRIKILLTMYRRIMLIYLIILNLIVSLSPMDPEVNWPCAPDTSSAFVTLSVHISPHALPKELIPLLPLYTESFFSLPVIRSNGQKLSFEEVVKQLDSETVEYAIYSSSSLGDDIKLIIQVSKSLYPVAIEWAKDLLWGSVFDIQRYGLFVTRQFPWLTLPIQIKSNGHQTSPGITGREEGWRFGSFCGLPTADYRWGFNPIRGQFVKSSSHHSGLGATSVRASRRCRKGFRSFSLA